MGGNTQIQQLHMTHAWPVRLFLYKVGHLTRYKRKHKRSNINIINYGFGDIEKNSSIFDFIQFICLNCMLIF